MVNCFSKNIRFAIVASVLVENAVERVGQRRGEGAVEARRLVPVALLREVHLPAAVVLPLERVPEAQLADATDAVGRDEREERDRRRVAERKPPLAGRAPLRRAVAE